MALRPFEVRDFEAAQDLSTDPVAARWVPPLPASDGGGVVAFFDACRRAGELLHLVIADVPDDGYLGEVMLAIGEQGVAEIGCGLLPAGRGRGVAVDAVASLSGWAFATLDLGRIQAFVATENHAALRLVERAGFRREGVLRAYWDGENGRLDAVVLSLLPGDRAPFRPPGS